MTTNDLIQFLRKEAETNPASEKLLAAANCLEEQENELLTEKAYKANLLSANTALSNELQDAHEKLLSALGDDMDAYIEESIIVREDDGKFVFCFPYIEGKKMEWETMEKLLNDFSRQESWFTNCCYNPRSWEYTREMYHASVNTRKDFPALHAAIFGTDNTDPDFVFSKGPDDHYLYYFNPCSNAGGQIVICPFDDEMAKRVIAGEDFVEVAAEAPQYLADINHISFFDTISELIELFKEGKFIGKSTSKEDMISLMKKVLGTKKRVFSELEIRPDFTIKEDSIVALHLHGGVFGVRVFRMFEQNGEVFIESLRRVDDTVSTHTLNQYKEFGTLLYF